MIPQTVIEQLLFSTIRIETIFPDGNTGIGTGFIFEYQKNNHSYPFLVTNKHVVKGAKEGILTFTKMNENGTPNIGKAQKIKVPKFHESWNGHPNDEIDVCVMVLAPIFQELHNRKKKIFFRCITEEIALDKKKSEDLDALEDIVFIGYPSGIWDKKNLTPVIRKGITATPIYLDHNDQQTFLIDASVFPGSSGSPVFIYNGGNYTDKKKNSLIIGGRIIFLGLIASVHYRVDENQVVVKTTKFKKNQVTHTQQMIDLGIVFKAETIVETIESTLKKFNQ